MGGGIRLLLIAMVIVLLVVTFVLLYKDILKQNGITFKSSMKIDYDATGKTITYSFSSPMMNVKYAGTSMLLTSFNPDSISTMLYPTATLDSFINAIKTVPVVVAITPIDSQTNAVTTNAIPRAYTGDSITIYGTGVLRLTVT